MAMLSLTSLTVTANVLLTAAIIWRRAWRIVPTFCAFQFLTILFTIALSVLYWMPSIPDEIYHSVWLGTDQIDIVLEAFAAWELFGLRSNIYLFWMAILMLIHDVMKIEEYLMIDTGRTALSVQDARFLLNLILTLLLAAAVYALSMCDDPIYPTPPTPVDPPKPQPIEPDTDPGLPPHKP
jgi:hypothetical protein